MKLLLMLGVGLVVVICYVTADEASKLGPEERRTLLDDDVFTDHDNERNYYNDARQRNCAHDYEDCTTRSCCNECTRCSCDRNGKNCQCNGKSELAMFLGLCRG